MVSSKFLDALRDSDVPMYKTARNAGVKPTWVYRVNIGIENPAAGNEKIVAIGKVLGLKPEECFQEED